MAAPKRHVFTSESVTEGHPDKVADQISDAVLDAILSRDPAGRVACETLVTTGMAVVAGEITTKTYVHIPDLVRETVERIGYTDASYGMDGRTCAVLTSIDRQSPDIAMGVDADPDKEQGAGDQGMMFGYATNETRERMPLPIMLAHRIAERLAAVRKGLDGLDRLDWLRPDGKSQVSVEYEGDRPVAVRTVVVSTQHAERNGPGSWRNGTIREGVIEEVIKPVLDKAGLEYGRTKFLINPTGRFVIGGPHGDAGPHRPEDHRGHLRRDGPPRGRRVQRQGSVQGGPLGGLRRPLGRQEHRRGQAGAALRGADRLRHRRGAAGVHHGADLRHRRRCPTRSSRRSWTRCSISRPRASLTPSS